MELVSVLRVLARRRLLVAAGLVTAAVIGFVATGATSATPLGAPERHTTNAHSQILIDTPQSLLADLAANASAIGIQTVLLADQLPKRAVAAAIALAAGIAPKELTVLATDTAYPAYASPLATRGAEVASAPTGTYVITVTASARFPVIALAASGPDRAIVRRLVQAPTAVLRSLAAARAQSPPHELSVKALTPAVVGRDAVSGGHGGLVGLIVFVALSALWCGALVIADGIARSWRATTHDASAPVAV